MSSHKALDSGQRHQESQHFVVRYTNRIVGAVLCCILALSLVVTASRSKETTSDHP